MTLLIHLDRKGAAILSLITGALNCLGKSLVENADATIHYIFNAQQDWHFQPALLQAVDNFGHGDSGRCLLSRRTDLYLSLGIDAKITTAPLFNAVKFGRLFGGPCLYIR